MLLHVMRLLKLESPRPVRMDEILQGCERWLDDPNARRHRKHGAESHYHFQLVATNWFRFQGNLLAVPEPVPPFGNLLSEFVNAMRSQRGLAFETLKSYRTQTLMFLNWVHSRCSDFSKVRAVDIEEYFDSKQSAGWSRTTVSVHCRTLRIFFGYAEHHRWCSRGTQSQESRCTQCFGFAPKGLAWQPRNSDHTCCGALAPRHC